MEHLSTDAVRNFFLLRMQLVGFAPSEHWQEAHSLKAAAWLEERDERSLFAWLVDEGDPPGIARSITSLLLGNGVRR